MMPVSPKPDPTTTPAAPVEVYWGAFVANVPSDRDGRRFAMVLKECGRRHGLECVDFGSFEAGSLKEARTCRSVAMVRNGGQHNDETTGSF